MGFQAQYSAPPGVFDILPEDLKDCWKESGRWQYVENAMKKAAEAYGFREIRTPLFERTELFTRSVGETSDIVSKEMYTFLDKGGRSLTLRPEGTAPVVRAAIENRLLEGKSQKFYYFGPMFRYERAQAGRYRQFHQFGVEAYGNGRPEQDAEIIDLAYSIYRTLGIKNLKVSLSSLGDKECRETYKVALLDYLKKHHGDLSEDSRTRFENNPLRVLDSKSPQDRKIVENAPSILNFLNEVDKAHFEKLKSILQSLQIPLELDDKLVRGLDYYQKTVFEIVSEDLGAQNAICGGGRYDGLVRALGGPDVPCTGFAAGLERTLQVMLKQDLPFQRPCPPVLYLIPLGEPALSWSIKTAHELREKGIGCEVDLDERKVGKAFGRASELGAKWAAAIGERELSEQVIELKELATQIKTVIPFKSLIRILQIDHNSKPFLVLYEQMLRPFENDLEKDFFLKRILNNIDVMHNLSEELKKAMTSLKDYIK